MKWIRNVFLMVTIVLFSTIGHHYTFAASKTDSLVNAAASAGKVLYNLTTVENKGTGKNVPTKEYNTAVQKYKAALTAVNKQTGKQKKINVSKLSDVKTKIDRGKKYIDAVTYGKKLIAKKATLDNYVKKGVMDSNTVNSYVNLSSTLKSYSPKFNAVYGKKTQDKIKSLYKTPVDKIINDLLYPVTVKQTINETSKLIKATATSSNLANQYKKIVYDIDLIKQSNYKKQLAAELKQLNAGIPAKLKTGTFADLITMEAQFEELDGLISKGRSDQKVPGLYQTLKTEIGKYSPKSEQGFLNNRFKTIMDQLKVSTKELKGMLTKAAIAKGVPPEIVKAIAVTENGPLQQFQANGDVFTSSDNGFGLMQVTPLSEQDQRFDWNRVKYDLSYNIEAGVEILLEKWKFGTGDNPVFPSINKDVNGKIDIHVLENWYFAIMAYNGLSFKNDPNTHSNPYQVKVYTNLHYRTLMNPEILTGIQMTEDPITHLPSFQDKMSYSTKKQTKSTQLYHINDRVTITSKSKFRTVPSTIKNIPKEFPAGTKVTILSGPIEDDNAANLFNWYKVSLSGVKGVWYVASSNLQ